MKTDELHLTTRPCTACGRPALYEPLTLELGPGRVLDLAATADHFCDDCAAERAERVAAAERDARNAELRDRWESTIPAEYRATDIDDEGFNRAVWIAIRNHPFEAQPLGLVGPPGRCKTRFLALFARKAIAAGLSIGWLNTFDLIENVEARAYGRERVEAGRVFRAWRAARVLFLDDLGKTSWTGKLEAALFELLEYRHGRGLVTHWSLNPLPDDYDADFQDPDVLTAALDPEGVASRRNRFAPILSRLLNRTTIVPLR